MNICMKSGIKPVIGSWCNKPILFKVLKFLNFCSQIFVIKNIINFLLFRNLYLHHHHTIQNSFKGFRLYHKLAWDIFVLNS